MSSNEDEYNDGESSFTSLQALKKRRVQRACDICRRKKIRCDGVQMPGNRCSNCVAYSFDCTYIEAAKKRGPPKGYVERLENRLEKLEGLLRKLCPDENLLQQLDTSLEKGTLPAAESSSIFTTRRRSPQRTADPTEIATSIIRNFDAPPDDFIEDNAHLILADNLKSLSIDPVDYRFFGKSSGAMLIQTAIELKNEYTGSDHDFRKAASVLGNKREEFWVQHPWEGRTSLPARANYTFPEPDFMVELVDLYFKRVNLFLPLLHRPSFERSIAAGFHLENDGFGGVVLLVCAIGSRFSEDRRVLLDGHDSFHSAGWKWFEQVQMVRKSLLSPPSLYDLQYYCLSVQFLQGSSAPQSCWTLVGIGIRLAQDVGAHRKKASKYSTLTAEDELWKRAFWVLVCMDRTVSAALGRPCAIQDEDFDLDMPIECDDEYWDTECDDPEQRWHQPPGKPSLISAFILFLRLNQIIAFSLRTIYSINKSKILLGFVGPKWEQHIVAELDSTLNKWVDSIPAHLRWDPTRENDDFFNQSVILYCAYYHIQILIHRPFIPSPSRPSPLSFPSLAICTNAARSCSHVVDIHQQRSKQPPPQLLMCVFTSGIVLLLSIWGGKRSGLSTDPNKEMVDVHKCMKMLRSCEKQWHSAGRLWDILYELASVGDLPLPQTSPPSNKRERDSETPISSLSPSSEPSQTQSSTRPIAGSRRVKKETLAGRHAITSPVAHFSSGSLQQTVQDMLSPRGQQFHKPSSDSLRSESSMSHQSIAAPQRHHGQYSPEQTQQQRPPLGHQFFSLPMYSQDLGKLPLHGQLQFSSAEEPSYWYNSLQAPEPGPSGVTGHGNSLIPGAPNLVQGSSMSQRPSSEDMANYATSTPLSGVSQDSGYDTPSSGMGSHGQMEVVTYSSAGSSPSSAYSGLPVASGSGTRSPGSGMYGHSRRRGMSSQMQLEHFAMHQSSSASPASATSSNNQPFGSSHPPNNTNHSNQSPEIQYPTSYVDSDTMAMWSNAPTGFELDEWGTYLMNVSEIAHGSGSQSF